MFESKNVFEGIFFINYKIHLELNLIKKCVAVLRDGRHAKLFLQKHSYFQTKLSFHTEHILGNIQWKLININGLTFTIVWFWMIDSLGWDPIVGSYKNTYTSLKVSMTIFNLSKCSLIRCLRSVEVISIGWIFNCNSTNKVNHHVKDNYIKFQMLQFRNQKLPQLDEK